GNGFFFSHDGRAFTRVERLGSRAASGAALDGKHLWVATPGALYRLRPRPAASGQGPAVAQVFWMPGGSRAVQAVAASGGRVWLATEDRGVVRLDVATGTFTAIDRAAGLASSWTVDVAVDAAGVVHAATLRHGLVRLSDDGHPLGTVDGAPDAW